MGNTTTNRVAAEGNALHGDMLEALMAPRSIAVIGASRNPIKVGHLVLQNLVGGGFPGQIVPINPNAEEILGLKCVPSLAEAGMEFDMGVITVPAGDVPRVIDEAIECRVKSLVVITAGFREAGAGGQAVERDMLERCRRAGIHLLGPNCLGIMNTDVSMNASFAAQMPGPGHISVVSQSGALCSAILDMANTRGLGLAKVISIGNKAMLSEIDFLRVLARDPQTKVIACYLESVDHGDEFIRVAEETCDIKPVVVLKAGVTTAGARAASSHTGALAGGAEVYAAAFRRSGIIHAHDFQSLFDITTALAMQPLPKGNRVAVITNAGGPGILAADAIEQLNMKVRPLQEDLADRLKHQLPASAHVGNPIDVLGDAPPERYEAAINATLDDDTVDGVIVILTPQAMTQPAATARTMIKAYRGNKPVLAAFMGGRDVAVARREFVAADVPDYATPDRAAVALKAMYDYANWRARPPHVVTRIPVDVESVEALVDRCRAGNIRQVGEADAKSILGHYGFTVMPGGLARSGEEACALAERVGFPVAMKIVSPDIVHKSDIGGVRLSLWSRQEVLDAYDLMTLRIGRRQPEANIHGVYIERMAPAGREVIIGMARDPQFGPVLMFGLGGIFVEVMRDVSFYLAPISDSEAREMLARTRSYALLQGARGHGPVDLDAIVLALQRISQLAVDLPALNELDINPFIVGGPGEQSIVADARMTFQFDDPASGGSSA